MGKKSLRYNPYRYYEALRISKELVKDGMIIGEELTNFIKGLGLRFKDDEFYEFELLVLDCVEELKKYIVIKDLENNMEYKFEKAKDASVAINVPVENIRNSLYGGDIICKRFKASYGYWTTKDLINGISYYQGRLEFDYKKEVKKNKYIRSKYLNSKIKICDTQTGLSKIYKDGYSVCSMFKINRAKLTDCVKKKCKLKGRFILELVGNDIC